jgi:hypothetical protein
LKKGDATGSEFPLLQRGQGNFELSAHKVLLQRKEPVAGFSMGTVLTILKNCFKWKSSDKYWETFPNKKPWRH